MARTRMGKSVTPSHYEIMKPNECLNDPVTLLRSYLSELVSVNFIIVDLVCTSSRI